MTSEPCRSSFSLTRLAASASASRKSRLTFTRHKTRRENRGFYPAWRPNSVSSMAFWLIYKADAQPCLTQSKNCEAEQRVRSSSSICVARHNIYEAFIVRRGTSVLGGEFNRSLQHILRT